MLKIQEIDNLIIYSYYYTDETKSFIFNDKNLNSDMKNNTIIFNYIEVKTPSDILNSKGTYLFITGTKNILVNEKELSKNDSDNEKTFI